jgi:hydroxyquinol 1,2-dioxygenase
VPSIRFDLKLSREGEADKTSGRVGSDPAAILKEAKVAAPAPAAS